MTEHFQQHDHVWIEINEGVRLPAVYQFFVASMGHICYLFDTESGRVTEVTYPVKNINHLSRRETTDQ